MSARRSDGNGGRGGGEGTGAHNFIKGPNDETRQAKQQNVLTHTGTRTGAPGEQQGETKICTQAAATPTAKFAFAPMRDA